MRKKKQPLLSMYDRICGTRTMADLSQFLPLRNTLRVESRQLASTNEFLIVGGEARDLDLTYSDVNCSIN